MLPEAIERLVAIMRGPNDRNAIEAVKVLLVRGIGKELEASQLQRNAQRGAEVGADIDVKTLSDQQLEEIHAIVRRGMA